MRIFNLKFLLFNFVSFLSLILLAIFIIPSSVSAGSASCASTTATISWADYGSEERYWLELRQGDSSGATVYNNNNISANITTWTVSGLSSGQTYWWRVSAYIGYFVPYDGGYVTCGGIQPTPTPVPQATPRPTATPVPTQNRPPSTPPAPFGPDSGSVNTTYTFSTTGSDPENSSVKIGFLWGDNSPTTWTSYKTSGSTYSASHSWTSERRYCVQAVALTIDGQTSPPSDCHYIQIGSIAPSPTPTPVPTSGPSVSIVSPANGSTVSNSAPLYASAQSQAGIDNVTFYVDNSQIAKITSPTNGYYIFSWYTPSYSDGAHTIHAWAADRVGKQAMSGQITVTVANGVKPTPTPTPPPGQPTPTPTPPPAQTPPNPPSNLSFTTLSACDANTAAVSIRINWLDNSNNEDGFNIYKYQPGVDRADGGWPRIDQVGPNVKQWEGTVNNVTQWYLVEAYNSAGSHSSYERDGYTSYTPNCAGVTPIPTPQPTATPRPEEPTPTPVSNRAPSIPSKLTISSQNPQVGQNVTLSATASDLDNDRIKITFAIVKEGGGEANTAKIDSSWSNSGCFSGCTLSANYSFNQAGTYYVYAIAVDQKGIVSTNWSDILVLTVGGTTTIPFAGSPAAPTNVSAAVVSCLGTTASVLITWKDNSNNEEGFKIYKWEQGVAARWGDPIAIPGPSIQSFTWNDAKAATSYWISVGAYNSAGIKYSNQVESNYGFYVDCSKTGVDNPAPTVPPTPSPTLRPTGQLDIQYFKVNQNQVLGARTLSGSVLAETTSGPPSNAIKIDDLPDGKVNDPYMGSDSAVGIWVYISDEGRWVRADETQFTITPPLPSGLFFNDANDVIDGVPKQEGTYDLTVSVTVTSQMPDGSKKLYLGEKKDRIVIYPSDFQTGDLTPPVDVKIISPENNSTFYAGSGDVTVKFSAKDNETGIGSLEMYVDGKYYKARATGAGQDLYQFVWRKEDIGAGNHTLHVIAYDRAPKPNPTASQVVNVTISPPPPDFAVNIREDTLKINDGGTAIFNIDLTYINDWKETLILTPIQGVSLNDNAGKGSIHVSYDLDGASSVIPPRNSFQLSLKTDEGTSIGRYVITVTACRASDGTNCRTDTMVLEVESISIAQGRYNMVTQGIYPAADNVSIPRELLLALGGHECGRKYSATEQQQALAIQDDWWNKYPDIRGLFCYNLGQGGTGPMQFNPTTFESASTDLRYRPNMVYQRNVHNLGAAIFAAGVELRKGADTARKFYNGLEDWDNKLNNDWEFVRRVACQYGAGNALQPSCGDYDDKILCTYLYNKGLRSKPECG